jgi:hypothetical protein
MTTTVDAIYNAVSRIRAETFKGIGVPVMEVPAEKVSVAWRDGKPTLYMTMHDVIELATSILDMQPPTTQ